MTFNYGFQLHDTSEIMRLVLIIVLPLVVLQLVLLVSALVSLLRKPYTSGNDKVLWLAVIILINIIGPIIYFAIGSAKLDEKAAQEENKERFQ